MKSTILNVLAGGALVFAGMSSHSALAGQKVNFIFASNNPGALAVLIPGPSLTQAASDSALPPAIIFPPQVDRNYVRQYGPYPISIDKASDFLMVIRYGASIPEMFEIRTTPGPIAKSGSMGIAVTTQGDKVTGCMNTNNFPSLGTPSITAELESISGGTPTCIITFNPAQ